MCCLSDHPADACKVLAGEALSPPTLRKIAAKLAGRAQNAFGALVRSQYFCLVHARSNQVIEISIGR